MVNRFEAFLETIDGEDYALMKKMDLGQYVSFKDYELLSGALVEIIEIYAGMDGFEPETSPEAYQQRIIEQMYEAARAHAQKYPEGE